MMCAPVRRAPDPIDFLLLLLLAALFGASFMFTHLAVAEIPPLTVVATRIFIAFLLIYPIMRYKGQRLPSPGIIWVPALASAVFGYALPFALISWGQLRVSASLAAIFMAVMPIATLVLAHIFTGDEKFNRWKFSGVLCGLAGVIILFGVNTLRDLGGPDAIAQLAILAAAVCYSVNAIVTRSLTGTPRFSMLALLMLISSCIMLPLSFLVEAPYNLQLSAKAIGSVLVLAIGPTALGALLILVIIKRQGANFLSQLNFIVPLFGIFFGWIVLGERLSSNAWLALAVVLAGVALSRRGTKQPHSDKTTQV